MAKDNAYQCESCAKFGRCYQAVAMALAGKVIFCGKWEKDYKTSTKLVD